MKSWYESKTVWVNVITTVLAVLALLPEGGLVPPQAVPYILLVDGILNVVLRIWFTDKPVR
jgi:hypothetical protein